MKKLHLLLASAVMSLCVMFPRAALPCGPGVHIRESDRIWEMLTEEYPAFKELEDTPLFDTYLHLGSIMPDFQWFLPIPQGHSSEFSVYLIHMAMDQDPRFQLMALGHLMHNSVSDPLCEQFWTPTLMASAPLGMVSLLEGYADDQGMAEGVTEVLGDPIVGDWDALIEMAYDVFLEGEDAQARGHEAILWYVDSMNAYYGSATDGEAVWQGLVDKVNDYQSYIAGFDREGAKQFFHELRGETPADMMNLLTGDLIASVAGDAAKRNRDYDLNIGFVMQSAIVDQAFWDIYQDTLLSDLSAFWYIDRLNTFAETLLPDDTTTMVLGWPSWNHWPIISGNIMSTMQFLPELHKVVPGLIVDEVTWMDSTGKAIGQVNSEMLTSTLRLRVRFYTAYDFDGEIRLAVKGDLPGLDQSSDPTCGQHAENFTMDPRTYVTGPRSYIETEFQPGAALVDGFYFELYAHGESKPWFTSNWDEIIASGEVPVYQDIYRNNFATYGKWPPSLPMAGGAGDCEFLVMARTFPDGGPIANVSVTVGRTDEPETAEIKTRKTKTNGVATFDLVEPGPYEIIGHLDESQEAKFVPVGETPSPAECPATGGPSWTMLQYHVIPVISVPGGISGRNDCVVFNTNADEFWGRAEKFLVTVLDYQDETVIAPEVAKNARPRMEVCFPTSLENGTTIRIKVVPQYVFEAGLGVEGNSGPILVDSTVPIVDSVEFTATGDDCLPDTNVYPFRVDLYVTANPGPIDFLDIQDADGAWTPLVFESVPGEIPGTERLTANFEAGMYKAGDAMLFRLTNRAGVSTEHPVDIPQSLACPAVVEPLPDTTAEDVIVPVDTGRDVPTDDIVDQDTVANDTIQETDDGNGGGGGGCSSGSPRGNAGLLLVGLMLAAIALKRRFATK